MNPFEPLSAAEIERPVTLFRDAHNDQSYFSSCSLLEPEKADVKAGNDVRRIVRLLGTDTKADGGFFADIDLTSGEVKGLTRLGLSAQGPYGFAEIGLAIQLTKASREWRDAVKKRGVACESEEELALIQIDPWPAGGYANDAIPKGHRAVRCIAFVKEDITDNGYALSLIHI